MVATIRVPHEKRSGTVTVSTLELRAPSITPAQVAALFAKRCRMQIPNHLGLCQTNAVDLIIG